MLSPSDQQDILNNDAKILGMTSKKGTVLTLPGDVFPDGQPLSADIGGELNFNAIQSWLSHVRGVWNARQASKEAEETRSAAARRATDQATDADSSDGGGGGVPVEDGSQVSETSLEDTIRAKIAMLDRTRSKWKDSADTAWSRYSYCSDNLKRVEKELEKATWVLHMIEAERDDDTPTDSSQDSIELPEEEEQRADGNGDSDGMVRRAVP
jgi:hypothetical protein